MLAAGVVPCISDACAVGDSAVVAAAAENSKRAGTRASASEGARAVAAGAPTLVATADGGGGDGVEVLEGKRKGLVELAVELGPAGLMVGWKERLVHVMSIISIQLLCYDNIKQALHVAQ